MTHSNIRSSLALAFASVVAGCGSDMRMPGQSPDSDSPAPDAESTPSTPDAPTAPPGKVPMFIAQGTLGRTIVSCDDGQTWVGDHSWSSDGDPMMCKMNRPHGVFISGRSIYIGDSENHRIRVLEG